MEEKSKVVLGLNTIQMGQQNTKQQPVRHARQPDAGCHCKHEKKKIIKEVLDNIVFEPVNYPGFYR